MNIATNARMDTDVLVIISVSVAYNFKIMVAG